jgi:hypothetical protein
MLAASRFVFFCQLAYTHISAARTAQPFSMLYIIAYFPHRHKSHWRVVCTVMTPVCVCVCVVSMAATLFCGWSHSCHYRVQFGGCMRVSAGLKGVCNLLAVWHYRPSSRRLLEHAVSIDDGSVCGVYSHRRAVRLQPGSMCATIKCLLRESVQSITTAG